ncbi:hypothetical protein [Pseudomonas phage PAShipCat1]
MNFSRLKFHLNAAEQRSARPPSRPLFNKSDPTAVPTAAGHRD